MQTWPVPTGVQSVALTLIGGAGGPGGNGAVTYASTTTATLTIPPGVTALDVAVGVQGEAGLNAPSGSGGWPNGGSSGTNGIYYGSGGGGSTDIRPSGAPFTSTLIVTGGAGGTGGYGGTSWGGVGGFGSLNAAGFGRPGEGTDAGAGGAGGNQPNGGTGQGGYGAAGPNHNSGSGGGGGGGWMGGAGGLPGTADAISFFSGGGGGGGGGIGAYDRDYVTGIWGYEGNAPGAARIEYLDVARSSIPTLAVGTAATWTYDAGADATYALTSGSLPPGLTFDGNSGQVQGVPTQTGTFQFTITASVYPDGTNAVSTANATTVNVNTGGPADLVATSATSIGTTFATLNGSVVAGRAPVTDITCAYSTTNPGGNAIVGPTVAASPASVQPSPTGAATAVTCPVTGLVGNQLYYFQLRGTQQGTPVRSGTASFTTGSAPAQPGTLAADDVRQTTATGNGQVTATQNITAIFCRAATTISGVATGTGSPTPITATASPASTTGIVTYRPVSCGITGLTPNTVYHYAVFATDASGTAMSPQTQSFTTQVSPPRVGTITAGAVGTTTASIDGSVIPTNEAVTGIYCRYIASPGNPARGTAVAATPFQVGRDPVERPAACNLSGLAPGTTYLVRMEATDRDGTAASGNVVRLTTAAAPAPTPAVTPVPAPVITPTVSILSARAVAGRSITMRVRTGQAGTIRVVGTYPVRASRTTARRTATTRAAACTATRAVRGAGTFVVSCPLTARAKARLKTGPLSVTLRTTLATTSAGSATATRTVRVPRFPPRVPPVTG